MRQGIGVDFQTNYNRLIEPDKRVMPCIFDGDEPFEINVPSFEEYLAEKLCIIVESNKTDVLNTRLKDFYDIYQLHGGKYDYDKLTTYFGVMLLMRGKIDPREASTMHLNQQFIKEHEKLWKATQEKYDFLDKEIDLEGTVYYTRAVLREQLQKQGIHMPNNTNIKSKVKRA
jgi:predicted nucleotidyltransferase component of viral defense system